MIGTGQIKTTSVRKYFGDHKKDGKEFSFWAVAQIRTTVSGDGWDEEITSDSEMVFLELEEVAWFDQDTNDWISGTDSDYQFFKEMLTTDDFTE